ncbi:MAG: GTPase HflX [Anaerolineales bacterium]|nr:GTPase HflX [Anaerolineales bacterium]
MSRSKSISTTKEPQAFLFGIHWKNDNSILSIEDSLAELAVLCRTAGMNVVGQDYQRILKPDSATLIGSGKVEELKRWVEETRAEIVVFDEELSPRHLRELQDTLGISIHVLDRTAVILDIFAQHAHTREGALQVELAQYEYRLPRLTRAWTHLARQAGGASGRGGTGGVGLRGPGETQLEIDRREISKKIVRLKKELETVRDHRNRYRDRRRRSGLSVAALVGYTNAGKSTLLNTLTDAGVFVADQLFATLDPTTRRVRLPGGKTILFTDTVGFIQKLPTSLIAAFRATLEEISEAAVLLHVVDVSHPNAKEQVRAVHQTLHALGLDNIPVVTALNKVDKLPAARQDFLRKDHPNTVPISALSREGIPELLETVEKALFDTMNYVRVKLPFKAGRLLNVFHEEGTIESLVHRPDGVLVSGRIPGSRLTDFRPYLIEDDRGEKISTS